MQKNVFRSHFVCSHPYISCKHLSNFVFSPCTVWVFSLDQESILCLPTLAQTWLQREDSKVSKFSIHKDTKTSACLAVQLSCFALVSSLIFVSCCAGSGLLKYDGCSDWTCGMNPWNFGGVYNCYDYWYFALRLFYTCLLWNEKKILWPTFRNFFLIFCITNEVVYWIYSSV